MDTVNLIKNLTKLKEMPCDKQIDKVEKYSVASLEFMAGTLYDEYSFQDCKKKEILDNVLRERAHKLNKIFKWTADNKKIFLTINDKITLIFEKAYNEAIKIANEFEKRIIDNDDFIKDCQIEIKISLYMDEAYYSASKNHKIGDVLSEPISNYYPISLSIGHYNFKKYLSEKPLFLDKTINCNIDFGDTFNNEYIGYAMNILLDNNLWSFHDIVNVKTIWADVVVAHQHYEGNI